MRGLIWAGLAVAIALPLGLAAMSPLLPSRNPAYIVGGFAGIACLALFLVQPLLATGALPGAPRARQRQWHRWTGGAIVLAVFLHIGGLYLTSPPDALDALMLVSPTPFSVYGVLAMWAVLLSALLVAFRRRLALRYLLWRLLHNGLAAIAVVSTIVHALQIDGAMETVSKWVLALAVLATTAASLWSVWAIKSGRQT